MKTKTYEIGEIRVWSYNKKKEVITICDNKTGKEAVFTPARWASFRLYMGEVDNQLTVYRKIGMWPTALITAAHGTSP